MSDYDDDELPPILVNSFGEGDNMSKFIIPDADVLASQRAEEAEQEEKIRKMRAENLISVATRTDSSGSEGDLGLTTTLAQLNMTAITPRAIAPPKPAELLASLVPFLYGDKDFVLNLQQCLNEAGDSGADDLFNNLVENVSSLLHSEDPWSEGEVIQVCVCLLCICVGEGSSRRGAGIALRQILDNVATEEQLKQLTSIISRADPCVPPLSAVGALRGRAGGGGDVVSTTLANHALKRILHIDINQPITSKLLLSESSPWRTLSAREQHHAVLLLGRAMRDPSWAARDSAGVGRDSAGVGRDSAGAAGDVLGTLAQVTAQCGDRNHPDRLRVLVGISKLQLLYRNQSL